MSSVVSGITTTRNMHEIRIRSEKNHAFVIEIWELASSMCESNVSVVNEGAYPPSYKIKPDTSSASDNFKAALRWIKEYIVKKDGADLICDIYNPCGCQFLSEVDQNLIAADLGCDKKVRVD